MISVKKRLSVIIINIILVLCVCGGCGSSVEKTAAQPVNAEREDTSAEVSVPAEVPQKAQAAVPSGRGTKMDIPPDIRQSMSGVSLPEGAQITFDDLAYLVIPHYNFTGGVENGFMVVNKALADEVLDIFAELYKLKYPIERMELIDYYDGSDFESIEANNTSAFNYRVSTSNSGKLSQHAYGCAIDINPQINPYVGSGGTGSHQNAKEYWNRNTDVWTSETAKAAYIGENTAIYDIFVNEHGWTWGGSWSSYRDYQHFEKRIYR